MAEYISEANRDDFLDKRHGSNKPVTVIVYQNGDQLNFFRIVDHDSNSPSESLRWVPPPLVPNTVCCSYGRNILINQTVSIYFLNLVNFWWMNKVIYTRVSQKMLCAEFLAFMFDLYQMKNLSSSKMREGVSIWRLNVAQTSLMHISIHYPSTASSRHQFLVSIPILIP